MLVQVQPTSDSLAPYRPSAADQFSVHSRGPKGPLFSCLFVCSSQAMACDSSVAELYFKGDRLLAEVFIHAQLLVKREPTLRSALVASAHELAASYGLIQDDQPLKPEALIASSENSSIQSYRRDYQAASSDPLLLKRLYLANPFYPDALLAYVAFTLLPNISVFAGPNSPEWKQLFFATCRLITQQWPRREELLTAFAHHAGSLTAQIDFPDRSLSSSAYYKQTAPSLAFLQELWIKGRYQSIMLHYANGQCSARSFPSSDYMLRVFTILGLLFRCQSLFRSIYSRCSAMLPPSSLSNMVFTELGMEALSDSIIEDLISDWRQRASSTVLPLTRPPCFPGVSDTKTTNFSIKERAVLAVMSADLRNHPVGRFWLPIARRLCCDFRLIHIDFSPSHHDDIRTELRSCSYEWWPYIDQSNHDLTQRLYDLKPSVLLDLGGHTADNRPAFLNQRFAPLQVTYLGFYGPSYGTECDWWILDRYVARYVSNSYKGAEPIWQLPCPSLCYDPALHRLPELDGLPYDNSGTPVLGSFNHTRKLTTESIARMAAVICSLRDSVFKFRSHSFYDPSVREFFLQRFVDLGVPSSQLCALPYAANPSDAMLDYCRIHLHLDCFPISGTTTTLDSLAMGVPVLTCPNNLYAGAISASLLESVGLNSMVCTNPSQLPDTASELLQQYRSPISRRNLGFLIRNSQLCDTQATPRHFSEAITSMLKHSNARVS
jgi:hypothetical protein